MNTGSANGIGKDDKVVNIFFPHNRRPGLSSSRFMAQRTNKIQMTIIITADTVATSRRPAFRRGICSVPTVV